ncbi:MAG: carboxypeptidase-like regulatory domain-containing protein [Salinibacter sp.]
MKTVSMQAFSGISRTIVRALIGVACLALLLPAHAVAQSRLTGTVFDAKTGRPLSNVNVFLDGTTLGSATGEQGQFTVSGIPPGSYTVVVSRISYQSKTRTVHLRDTTRTLTFELQPKSIRLKGVTVKESRETWLDRLDRFRDGFFGDVRQAQFCEFVNPEVLSFQKSNGTLVAHAKRPLRIRNAALGYEVTYHVSRYVVSSETRRRYGHFEFDPLEAESKRQRQEWVRARRRTYQGSFRHFIHALEAGTLKSEGFEVYWTSSSPTTRDHQLGEGGGLAGSVEPVSKATNITESATGASRLILTVPRGEFLEVRFVLEGESQRFARRYRGGDARSMQVSWIDVFGGTRVVVDTQSGAFVRRNWMGFGNYVLRGYWGWAETAATALPANYRPPGAPGA